MDNELSRWIFIVGFAVVMIVCIWLSIIEYREDKRIERFERRNRELSKAKRHRMITDAVTKEENEIWRNVG